MEAAGALTGLERIEAIFNGELPNPPIAELIDFAGIEAEEGRAVFAGTPDRRHLNVLGIVHGGYALTLLDSAMGCAIHTTLPAGAWYTTLEVKVNFTRPITDETGRVLCEGTVVHRGSRVATAEGRLLSEENGKLLAHGTTTCLIASVNGTGS